MGHQFTMHSAVSPPGSTRTSLFIIFWLDFMERKKSTFSKNIVNCTLIWFGNLLVQLDNSFASNCACLKIENKYSLCMCVCVCVCVWIVLKTFDIYYCLWWQELQGIFHGQYLQLNICVHSPLHCWGLFAKHDFHFPTSFQWKNVSERKYKFPTTLPCENLKRLLGYKKGNWGINLTLKSDSFSRRFGHPARLRRSSFVHTS